MRRFFIMISILILVSLACQTLSPAPTPTQLPYPTPTITPSPVPSLTPTPLPTSTTLPSDTPSPTPVPSLGLPDAAGFTVRYHPDDALFVGDLVSLEVISPSGTQLSDASLTVNVDSPNGIALGPASFSGWGIAGRNQATMIWVWDTSGLSAGEHSLYFSIQPQAITWQETITLQPADALPEPLGEASWASIQTSCCEIHYLTHTAAERDIQSLAASIEGQAQKAAEQMGVNFDERVMISILPRLLGHGGFASNEINVSYLDRNYAANDWDRIVHHEMIHILDGRLGGELRPTLFVEGLAVYLTGGHYKSEPLMERCSALLDDELDWFLPLQPLSDDFYTAQHEIGYLEAGAFVEYMVQRYGWEAFSSFYRDIHPAPNGKQSQAIDDALQRHFNTSFEQLEQDFITTMQSLSTPPNWAEDVYITITLFDTLRRYQQLLDPSAYFRTAWLLDTEQMRARNITADYLRHPIALQNLAIETMLVAAGEDLDNPPYPDVVKLLEAVNIILDEVENDFPAPFQANPLGQEYYSIVQALVAEGYEPQKVTIDDTHASAQVGTGSAALGTLTFQIIDGEWHIK